MRCHYFGDVKPPLTFSIPINYYKAMEDKGPLYRLI